MSNQDNRTVEECRPLPFHVVRNIGYDVVHICGLPGHSGIQCSTLVVMGSTISVGEHREQNASTRAGRAAALPGECCDRGRVRPRERLLPAVGQGASEVRDAAGPCRRRHARVHSRSSARLLGASFYLVAAAFDASGMLGLLDERRGRRGPLRLTPEIVAFLQSAEGSGATLADEVETRLGVRLHRRTVERARS